MIKRGTITYIKILEAFEETFNFEVDDINEEERCMLLDTFLDKLACQDLEIVAA